jgi:serine/threonine protein kinase
LSDRPAPGSQDDRPRTFGSYTLLEVLGRGGIGVVYRAVQQSLGRPVALKRLRIQWGDAEEILHRFRRGARAASKVEHPNAVRIHDYGVIDEEPYLVMNLLAGPDLKQVLFDLSTAGGELFGAGHHAVLDRVGIPGEGADTPAYVRRVAGLLSGPARALERYHEADIVHRDVKPANLILDGEGQLVLVDFDLVKCTDASMPDLTQSPLGSPVYMSPEQWGSDGSRVDERCDVYSLGAVLYELLTLRPPFEEGNPAILMNRVLRETPSDPVDSVRSLPRDARNVVLKCLEKRREDRYAGVGDLAKDLEALAEGAPVAARPVPRSERAARWVRRRIWPLVATCFLLLAALVAWAAWPRTGRAGRAPLAAGRDAPPLPAGRGPARRGRLPR